MSCIALYYISLLIQNSYLYPSLKRSSKTSCLFRLLNNIGHVTENSTA